MLTLEHSNHKIKLANNTLIIIEQATEKDYLDLANEDLKLEFDGERLFIHSPATKKHEDLVHYLLNTIKNHIIDHSLKLEAIGSRFALKLPNNYRPEPDIVVVKEGEVEDDDSIFEGVPQVVIEITSPSTRSHDFDRKLVWYQDNKIPEIWIVDRQEKNVNFYILDETKDNYKYKTFSEGEFVSKIIIDLKIQVKKIL